MGQAKTRRLALAGSPRPVEVKLSDKTALRLSTLIGKAMGARAVAAAAEQVAKAVEADYLAAVQGVLEIAGIETDEKTPVKVDIDRRRVVVGAAPEPAAPAEQDDEPAETA